MTAGGRKFHLEHFKCEEIACGVVIGADDLCYEHRGRHYCSYHYCQGYAKNCWSCGCPVITGRFVKRVHDGVEKSWHGECLQIRKSWGVELGILASHRVKRTDSGWTDGAGATLGEKALLQTLESIQRDIRRVWSVLSQFEAAAAAQTTVVMDALWCAKDYNYTGFTQPIRAQLKVTAAVLGAVQLVAHPGNLPLPVS